MEEIELYEETDDFRINFNNNLKTIFIDCMVLNERIDGVVMLRGLTSISNEVLNEEVRIATTEKNIKAIIKEFCQELDYYPRKKKKIKS